MEALIFFGIVGLALLFVIFPILLLILFSKTGRQQKQLEWLHQQVKMLQQSEATGQKTASASVQQEQLSAEQQPPVLSDPVVTAQTQESLVASDPAVAPQTPSVWEQQAEREQQKGAVSVAQEAAKATTSVVRDAVQATESDVSSVEQEMRPETPAPATPVSPLAGLFSWLLKGNPLAKLGILLLFFGLAYLLKYSIEQDLFPVELRLMSAALICMALLGVGWRLRVKQTVYALILQGGSVGALYITVYGTFQLYQLLPQLLAFGLMLVICAASVMLAVLQRALSLAVLASLGGYLAPLLLSTGSGNYIGLFSYYLLISCGILAISLWQSWRVLNLLGFVFTFGVGGLWGVKNYTPDMYPGAQFFLIANLLLFGVLTLLFALRFRDRQKRQVTIDGTMIFGTPLIGFSLQYGITQHWPLGPAFSALGFGLCYLSLTAWVLRRYPEEGRRLALSCLALGGAFVTLAIPLALSAQWTTVAWSLEGVGILWAGLAQGQRRMSWSGSGVLLLAAAAALQAHLDTMTTPTFLLTFSILSLSYLAAAGLWRHYPLERSGWQPQSLGFLTGGILFWLLLIVDGAIRLFPEEPGMATLAAITLSAGCWHGVGRRLHWRELGACVWLVLLFAAGILWQQVMFSDEYALGHPLSAGIWSLSWLALFVSAVLLLQRSAWQTLSASVMSALHLILFWLALLWVWAEINWYLAMLDWGYTSWRTAVALMVMAGIVLILWLLDKKEFWPFPHQEALYWLVALVPLLPGLLYYLLIGNLQSGQILGWSYLPLLNPLEESAMLALIVLACWRRKVLLLFTSPWLPVLRSGSSWLLWGLTIWWANGALLRGLAHYAGLGWSAPELWDSRLVQTTFALVWMLAALSLMLLSTRWVMRPLWFSGAALLGIVIAKLFLVDSASGGGLARAIAFLGSAALVLIVGYLAPLPPRRELKKEA